MSEQGQRGIQIVHFFRIFSKVVEFINILEARISLKAEDITTPVLINPADGRVYKAPKFRVKSGDLLLDKIPITETPLFIMEQQNVKVAREK